MERKNKWMMFGNYLAALADFFFFTNEHFYPHFSVTFFTLKFYQMQKK